MNQNLQTKHNNASSSSSPSQRLRRLPLSDAVSLQFKSNPNQSISQFTFKSKREKWYCSPRVTVLLVLVYFILAVINFIY